MFLTFLILARRTLPHLLRRGLGWLQRNPGATSLAQANRNRLLRRPCPMLPLTHMLYLFMNKLSSSCRWSLAFAQVFFGAFDGSFIRHNRAPFRRT
jgi:hypothetical protein